MANNDTAQTLKIGLTGVTGRVGTILLDDLTSMPHAKTSNFDITLDLSTLLVRSKNKFEQENPHIISTIPPIHIYDESEMSQFIQSCDCIIDFSHPELTLALAQKITQTSSLKGHPTVLVSGTTGLNLEQMAQLQNHAKNYPILYAANMSLGVNIMLMIAEKTANLLDDHWDIEISEIHHRNKIDAPSGTALALGEAVSKGRKQSLDDTKTYHITSHPNQPRQQGHIGFSVQRAGDVVGEHDVIFYGAGERLILSHRAHDRSLFSKGALVAAKWLSKQSAGQLYSMRDVIDVFN